jgi:hypothetical protein
MVEEVPGGVLIVGIDFLMAAGLVKVAARELFLGDRTVYGARLISWGWLATEWIPPILWPAPPLL